MLGDNKARPILVALLAAALTLSACSNGSTEVDQDQDAAAADADDSSGVDDADDADEATGADEDTTLVVAESGAPDTFDPTQSSANNTLVAWQYAYESLIEAQPDGTFEPVLATDWTVSDDGTVYSFSIREGVNFHNGEPLKADDVVYSMQRMMEEGIPFIRDRFATLESITETDASTVEFALTEPDSTFLSNLGNPYPLGTAILNRKAGEEGNPASEMIGTGPFKVVSYAPDRELVLEAVEDYWTPDFPKVKNLIVRYIPEQSAQISALKSGEVDMMFPTAETVDQLRNDESLVTQEVVAANTTHLHINTNREPFDNLNVSRAISLAIDREEIVELAYLGQAVPGQLIPGAEWALSPEDLEYQQVNVERAVELLADAGYPDGFALEIQHLSGYANYMDRFSEILQSQLAAIGITAEIVPSEFAVWQERLNDGDYQIGVNEFGYSPDPMSYILPRSLPNRQAPPPDELTSQYEAVRQAVGDDVVPAIQEAQRLSDEFVYPSIPIATRLGFLSYAEELTGVELVHSLSRRMLYEVGVPGDSE